MGRYSANNDVSYNNSQLAKSHDAIKGDHIIEHDTLTNRVSLKSLDQSQQTKQYSASDLDKSGKISAYNF